MTFGINHNEGGSDNQDMMGWLGNYASRISPDGMPAEPRDRYAEEQEFEENVRTAMSMMRPNRRERLLGWSEYRTGGAYFRATVTWDPAIEKEPNPEHEKNLSIPRLTDVLESILVGSVKNQDDLHAEEEFEIYRDVVRELYRRLDEMQSCYE
jgi:hypothetical protein